MVSHFQNQFQDLGLEIDSMEWDALLAAALLHDIGHGPFFMCLKRYRLIFPMSNGELG